jgi:hypothetical protein
MTRTSTCIQKVHDSYLILHAIILSSIFYGFLLFIQAGMYVGMSKVYMHLNPYKLKIHAHLPIVFYSVKHLQLEHHY